MTDLRTALELLREAGEAVVMATMLRPGEELGQRWIVGSFDEAPLQQVAAEALRAGQPRMGEQVLLEPFQPGRLAPWVHFAGQLLDQRKPCVVFSVVARQGTHPYQVGETFALDDRSHGLLPMDQELYLALHHAVLKSRMQPGPFQELVCVGDGTVTLLVERLQGNSRVEQ